MTSFTPVDVPLFDRETLWRGGDGRWIENMRMVRDGPGWMVSGALVGLAEKPYRLIYQVSVDRHWRPRKLSLDHPWGEPEAIRLRGDGEGGWVTALGDVVHAAEGCRDLLIGPGAFGVMAMARRFAQSGEAAYAGAAMTLAPFTEAPGAAAIGLRRIVPLGEGPGGGGRTAIRIGDAPECEIALDRDGAPEGWPGWFDLLYADAPKADDRAVIIDENPPIGTMMG